MVRTSKYNWLMLTLLAVLMAPSVSAALEPGYQLPAWLKIDFSLDAAPELGKQVTVNAALNALVADLPGCEIRMRFPSGVRVVGETPLWSCTLKKNEPVSFSTAIICDEAQSGAAAVLSVKTSYPVRKLKTLVLREYGTDDPEAVELIRQLNQLEGRYPVIRTLDLFVTGAEGFTGPGEPAFGRYLQKNAVPGGGGFVMKTSMFTGTMEKALAQITSFRRFMNILSQRPEVAKKVMRAGGSLESQLSEQVERLLFVGNMHLLSGKPGVAMDSYREAAALEGDEFRKIAAGNALALAHYLDGQPDKAVEIWNKLRAQWSLSPLMRYVDYNLGIMHLLNGDRRRALQFLRSAYNRKAAFTRVRELIEALE